MNLRGGFRIREVSESETFGRTNISAIKDGLDVILDGLPWLFEGDEPLPPPGFYAESPAAACGFVGSRPASLS